MNSFRSGTRSAIYTPSSSLKMKPYITQESQKYRDTIRRHMDLETIQRRLNGGSYASSAVSLHRDLLLLFTNAVVFFPPSSPHSLAAHQLRSLLLHHIHKQARPDSRPDPLPQPKPELEKSDPLLPKPKNSTPLIVCRKRTRPPSTTSVTEPVDATPVPPVVQPAPNKPDKPVTGVRSSRRNNSSNKGGNTKNVVESGMASTPGGLVTEDEKPKTPAMEKKKRDKKRSATDFLKRIKKNSPAKKSAQKKSGKESPAGKGSNNKKQETASPTNKSGRRPVRKAAGDQQTVPSGKRGKEGAAQEGRQPRKRARK